MIFGDVTTGASQDIKQATQTARAMVTQYGMSDKVGMINYGSDDDEVFIGRDLAHTRNYAEQTAALIDSEVKRIILPAMGKIGPLKFLFGTEWRPTNDKFGILPMIVASIYVTAGAILIGVPIALFTKPSGCGA